jgi:hypothetical protein
VTPNLNVSATYLLPSGFNDANEIAFDAAGDFYVTTWQTPARIVKFAPDRLVSSFLTRGYNKYSQCAL